MFLFNYAPWITIFIVADLVLIVCTIMHIRYVNSYDITDEELEQLSDKRTFMVNSLIGQVNLIIGLPSNGESAVIETLQSDLDTTVIKYINDNIEITYNISWVKEKVKMVVGIYSEDENFIIKKCRFSFKDNQFRIDKIFKFLMKIQDINNQMNNLTLADLQESIIPQIMKDAKNSKETPQEDTELLFNTISDFIIKMRLRKNLRNRWLRNTFFCLLYYVFKTNGENYLNYVKNGEISQEKNEKDKE